MLWEEVILCAENTVPKSIILSSISKQFCKLVDNRKQFHFELQFFEATFFPVNLLLYAQPRDFFYNEQIKQCI